MYGCGLLRFAPCFILNLEIVVKNQLILFAVLSLCSCASVNSGPKEIVGTPSLLSLPKPDELIIIGISPRLSDKADEINTAREDAARKVSMFHSVWATTETIQNIGAGYFDYYVETITSVDYNQNLEPYMERLSFDPDRDVTRNQEGTIFVRFTYPASFPGNISYYYGKNRDGSPEWTTNPPHEINGFLAGVGRSGRLSRVPDTILKAYEAAAASIASSTSTSITASNTEVQSMTESQIRSRSYERLTNFLVLETWIDPNTRAAWTLAVAQTQN